MVRGMVRNRRYSAVQVRGMLIDPYVEGSVLDVYPFLSDMVSGGGCDWDKYFRYLAFVYDKYSPMAREFANIDQRRREAGREVGFDYSTRGNFYDIELAYLRFQKSDLWVEIMFNDILLWEYAKKICKPVEEEDDIKKEIQTVELQGKILEQMHKMRANSASLRKEFYGEDRDLAAVEYNEITPEEVIKSLRRNK